jgi:hypothetical protein
MPAKCVSSVSPRFHYRRLAFCFLPLAAILEFPQGLFWFMVLSGSLHGCLTPHVDRSSLPLETLEELLYLMVESRDGDRGPDITFKGMLPITFFFQLDLLLSPEPPKTAALAGDQGYSP